MKRVQTQRRSNMDLLSYLKRTNTEAKPEAALDAAPEAKLMDATLAQLNEAVTSSDGAFVLFYSPRCGHCTRFKPEFERLSTLWDMKPSLMMFSRDGVDEDVPEYVSELSRMVPTMALFRPKKVGGGAEYITYEGERDADEIIKFVQHMDTQ